MGFERLTKAITLFETAKGWDADPYPKGENASTMELPAETYVFSYGLDRFRWYRVETGEFTGLEFQSFGESFEDLGNINSDGQVYFFASSAGWNASYYWYPIAVAGCPHPPKSERRLYTLKPGETLESYPQFAPRAEQEAWLEARQARWFPEQEVAPIRYVDHAKVLQCQTLDELCSLLRISQEELTFSEHVSDPGEEYRRQGFSLEMTGEEAYEHGRYKYYGFSWGYVKSRLETPRTESQIWKTPAVWVKSLETIKVRRATRTELVKKQKAYTFAIVRNCWTGEVYVSIS